MAAWRVSQGPICPCSGNLPTSSCHVLVEPTWAVSVDHSAQQAPVPCVGAAEMLIKSPVNDTREISLRKSITRRIGGIRPCLVRKNFWFWLL